MASDLYAQASAIRQRFATQWQAARAYTNAQLAARVAWEGVPFTKPDSEWVRFSILWGDAFELTMGGAGAGSNQIVGVVSVQVFVKTGTGGGVLEALCDDVRDIFQRVDVSGVHFEAPSAPKPEAPREADGWLQMTIDVPFTTEETI